jgi:DNA-binding winged helix-turn-helix (wHTH) protein/tetratricopeptide (TPR) repeat protein
VGDHLLFGDYELRTDSGELFRDGVRVALQPQPARLLELLARRSGEVVSREEIQRHLWGEETFVEFEQGLNFCIRKIRIAIEDSATEPVYLETVPRRGYRFLVPVRTGPARRSAWRAAAGLALGLMLLAVHPEPEPRPAGTLGSEGIIGPAFQAYTEGRFLARRRNPGDREKALVRLEDAMRLAPGFAPAHGIYARLRLDFNRPPEEVAAPAEAAARRALALDPCLNEARLVLVDIGLYFRFDWKLAKTEMDRALACDPRDSEVHRVHAAFHAANGRFGEAIAAARQAQLLDPKSEMALADLAWYSFLARRYDEALDLARRTLALQPEDTWTSQALIEAALAAGKPEIALAEANSLLELARSRGRPPLPAGRFESLRPFWDWVLQRRTAFATRAPLPPIRLAVPVLRLGDKERALRLVEESARRKFGWEMAFLAVDPRFDPLRAEPRFHQVLRSLGLHEVRSEFTGDRGLAVGADVPSSDQRGTPVARVGAAQAVQDVASRGAQQDVGIAVALQDVREGRAREVLDGGQGVAVGGRSGGQAHVDRRGVHRSIRAVPAVQGVGPGPARQHVVAEAPDEDVGAVSAVQDVRAVLSIQLVVPGIAGQGVGEARAEEVLDGGQHVHPATVVRRSGREVRGHRRLELDRVGPRSAVHRIGARLAHDDVRAALAMDVIVSKPAADRVVAAAGKDGVVALERADDVVPAGSRDDVVNAGPFDRAGQSVAGRRLRAKRGQKHQAEESSGGFHSSLLHKSGPRVRSLRHVPNVGPPGEGVDERGLSGG